MTTAACEWLKGPCSIQKDLAGFVCQARFVVSHNKPFHKRMHCQDASLTGAAGSHMHAGHGATKLCAQEGEEAQPTGHRYAPMKDIT